MQATNLLTMDRSTNKPSTCRNPSSNASATMLNRGLLRCDVRMLLRKAKRNAFLAFRSPASNTEAVDWCLLAYGLEVYYSAKQISKEMLVFCQDKERFSSRG